MGIPGLPGSQLPRGEDHIPREVADIKRSQREGFASVAESFGPVMADLAAKQAALEAQQVALAAQDIVIGGLITDLAAQDVTIIAQQATLTAQQATLTAQTNALAAANVTLSAAVANIQTLVGQQIDTATNTGASNNFGVTSGEGAYGAVSITVPAGFTQASIQVNGGAAMYYTGATNPEQLNARVVIGASGGTSFAIMVDTSSIGSRITSVAVSHTATFSGLTAGQVITAYLGLRSNSSTWPANTYNTAACSALAVFRR